MKKIFIIAGEASGDLHGSNLAKALLQRDPELILKGWGGDLMQKEGVEILSHFKERSLMGFIEVILHWRKIRAWFTTCKKQIDAFEPDLVVLIDYGGFNLRMARFVHNKGIKVHYYIPPKVWAWNKKRVRKLVKYTDKVSCILPFEEHWFRAHGVDARFVGNPLIKAINEYQEDNRFLEIHGISKPFIALLPGSRKQEIKRIVPEMVNAGRHMTGYSLVMAMAPGIDAEFYTQFDLEGILLIENGTYDILRHCDGAIVTSGTATLETALFNVPQVVVYKANAISYAIGKRVINVPFISLVNLILNKEAVTELIQGDAVADKISTALRKALGDPDLKKDYLNLHELLTHRDASGETAERILSEL